MKMFITILLVFIISLFIFYCVVYAAYIFFLIKDEKKMNNRTAKKLRKEVKNVYIQAQSVLYDQIKSMNFSQRLRFAFMILFKKLK